MLNDVVEPDLDHLNLAQERNVDEKLQQVKHEPDRHIGYAVIVFRALIVEVNLPEITPECDNDAVDDADDHEDSHSKLSVALIE